MTTNAYESVREDGLLPADPFTALRYHYGMLLGVDDFETEQGFHLGKTRLHNAWLHREGVVWGLDVRADVDHGEIEVTPGLALDFAGRELRLDARACLSAAAWYEKHRDDPDLDATTTDDTVAFEAHVVVRYKACYARQVPALADPCEGSHSETAYSRIQETVELLMRPGLAPDRLERPSAREGAFHRLRLLFGLEAARVDDDGSTVESDADVLARRAVVLALPAEAQPAAALDLFRRLAALDSAELAPASSEDGEHALLYPGSEELDVVLADVIGLTLRRSGDGWTLLPGVQVDTSPRPTHLPTATIQELLCGRIGATAPGGSAPTGEGPGPASASAAPRVDRSSVDLVTRRIRNRDVWFVTFRLDRPVQARSVRDNVDAFRVAAFSETDGWDHPGIRSAALEDDDEQTVALRLRREPNGDLIRVVAQGTGIDPVLGVDLVPLSGATDQPAAGTAHEGVDFVHMFTRGS